MEKVTVSELLTKDIKGKVIVFPTDTVYGIGAMYDDIDAIKRIYEIKGRSFDKPLAILTASKDIEKYVSGISDDAKQYMERWPGALTIIFKKSDLIDSRLVCGKDTVAFRMPDSNICKMIIEHFGLMATTSVNKSGQSELNSISEIEKEFGEKIDYLVVNEEKHSNKASMIVDCSSESTKIIRR